MENIEKPPMTNVNKLAKLGILGEIRLQYGADNKNDDSQDEAINELSNHALVKVWCTWHVGNGDWWDIMKDYFDKLERMK